MRMKNPLNKGLCGLIGGVFIVMLLVPWDSVSTTSGKAGGLYCEPLKAVIKA